MIACAVHKYCTLDQVWGQLGMAEAYHSWDATTVALRDLSSRSPTTSQATSIGLTAESREIPALRLETSSKTVFKCLIVGCHHAQEWISVEVPLGFADRLSGPLTSEERELVDQIEFTFVPMTAKDGPSVDVRGDEDDTNNPVEDS